jgi:ribosomal protein S18 acetylase RimI-like enzyme
VLRSATPAFRRLRTQEGKSVMKIQLIPPAFSWESQARQYAESGAPGLTLEQHMVEVKTGIEVFGAAAELAGPGVSVINCLLFRDEDGSLVAILNHYDGKNPLEAADAVTLWVRPDRQREGIGKMMTREAMQRWPGVRLENQRYTRMGMHLLKSLVRDNERKNNDG